MNVPLGHAIGNSIEVMEAMDVLKGKEKNNNLVDLCSKILSDDAIMFLINSYTTGLSKSVLENILKICVNSHHQGFISSDELGLPMKNSDLVLPCGIYARWEKEKTL